MLFFIPILLLSAVPKVFGCEGECIVSITNAFLGNYTEPIKAVLGQITKEFNQQVAGHQHDSTTYFSPFLATYQKESYAGMQKAIFPSYFHGKCQVNGVDPPGCPNPDCPVVCGTPGSMVHFYSKLKEIAFGQTMNVMQALATPGSPAYKEVERAVFAASTGPKRRMLGMYPRSLSRYPPPAKRSEDTSRLVAEIMKPIPELLGKECAGPGEKLSKCSWETSMKEYILSFP